MYIQLLSCSLSVHAKCCTLSQTLLWANAWSGNITLCCLNRRPSSQGSLQQGIGSTAGPGQELPIRQQGQQSDHQRQPIIKIALEAVLPDGSTSRFDVQQVVQTYAECNI